MRAPAEWEIVGGDPAPGDPAAFEELAGFFGDTATQAGDAAGRLRRLAEGCDDTIWQGQAAEAFREDLGKLPGRLDKLHESYLAASEALRVYGVSLRQLQSRATVELDKAIAADEEQKRVVEDLVAAAMPAAGGMPLPAGPGPSPADPAESARARLAAAKCEIETIRQEREEAEGKALGKLDHAGDVGIHNKSRWSRLTGAVVGAVSGFAHKSLRAIGDIADRFSDLFAVVGIALIAVALLVGTGGTAGPLIMGAMTWAFQAAAVTGAVSVGSKIISKAAFNDSDLGWGTLGKGATLAAVGVLGGWGKAGKLGGRLFRSARGLLPASRGAAKAEGGLSLLQRAPAGVQKFVAHGRRIGKEAIAKAKPLFLRGKELTTKGKEISTKYLGAKEAPTELGLLWKAANPVRKLWKEYGADPLRVVRQIELGPPPAPSVVRVTLRPAA